MSDADRPLDMLIVGAGLSGIGAAATFRRRFPQSSIAILESRERLGGTWDLFRYPGIRSDSDMFTLGYGFRPWREAKAIADRVGYPVLVRPSYVLGGRAMEICYRPEAIAEYMANARGVSPSHPILIDRFLEDAYEFDVDAVRDHTGNVIIGGIMQHIEQAGIHSGDSACSLPPYALAADVQDVMREQTVAMARELGVVGLMNVQFAIQQQEIDGKMQDVVFVLEVNPRASRTVPYVSKATGLPLAKIAARCMVGQTLDKQGIKFEVKPPYFSVKEAVFPFNKFPGIDPILGPEMRSTGEVMGIAPTFGESYAKSQIAAFGALPKNGTVFISLSDKDKESGISAARELKSMGFNLVATAGTAALLGKEGIEANSVRKHSEGTGPLGEKTIVEQMVSGQIDLVINTPVGRGTRQDGWVIRTTAIQRSIPCITTVAGFNAAVEGIKAIRESELKVKPLQEWLVEIAN